MRPLAHRVVALGLLPLSLAFACSSSSSSSDGGGGLAAAPSGAGGHAVQDSGGNSGVVASGGLGAAGGRNGGATGSGAQSGVGGTSSSAGGDASGSGGVRGDGGAGGAAGSGGTAGTGGSGTGGSGTGGAATFWPSGRDDFDHNLDAFAAWRGRPLTSLYTNTNYLPWSYLTNPGLTVGNGGADNHSLWDQYKDFKGVVVLSMSMAGPGVVDQAAYNTAMTDCAAGKYDADWETFGTNATARGRTGENTVASLAQEFNGTWFRWNPIDVGIPVWTKCWSHVYTAIHKTSSVRVIWTFSATTNTKKSSATDPNRTWAVDNAWDAYPGDAYVDIIGVDHYDEKAFGPANNVDWNTLCSNKQDFCYAAQQARAKGKKFAMQEWSMDRGPYGYGDNPYFFQMIYKFFADNRDILAFENLFSYTGDLGNWSVYPVTGANPKGAAEYQSLYSQK